MCFLMCIYLHILDCSTESVCHNAFLDMFLAQAKVRKFDMALGIEKNIFWLQIPIYNALQMQMFQCQYNFGQVKAAMKKRIKKP